MKYVSLVLMVCLVCGCGSTSPTHTWADEITTSFAEAKKVYPNAVIHQVLAVHMNRPDISSIIFEFYNPPHDIVKIMYNDGGDGSMEVRKAVSSNDLSGVSQGANEAINQALKDTKIDYNRAIEITREKGTQYVHQHGGEFSVGALLQFSPEIERYFPSSSSAWLVVYSAFPESTATIPAQNGETAYPTLNVWVDGKTGQVLWESDTSRFPPT